MEHVEIVSMVNREITMESKGLGASVSKDSSLSSYIEMKGNEN